MEVLRHPARWWQIPRLRLCRSLGWLALALIFAPASRAQAQAEPSREYQLKAVFLFNFAQFVEWPAAAFPANDAPLVVGLVGDDPFGAYLDALVKDEKSHDHPLIVKRFRTVQEIEACHVLFIGASEDARVPKALAALQGRSVLTVSDSPNFTREGGMIRFVTESGKLRLRINLEVARAAGLTLSSKLLRPADIVTANAR